MAQANSNIMSHSLPSTSLLTCLSLLLHLAFFLSPASGQSSSPLSAPSSGFYWFQLNASAAFNFSSNVSYSLTSWTDTQQQVTLSAVANSTLPLFDPVGLAVTFNSSALVAPSTFGSTSPQTSNVTVIATINLAAPCTFPACVLLSTAGRNVTGSLLLSAIQVPSSSATPNQQSTQYYLQLTLLTSPLDSITLQSSIPLSFSQWQYVTITFPPSLDFSASVELQTVVGCEVLTFVLPATSVDVMPAAVALSAFTIGDTGGLHASFRDVAIGFQQLMVGELDAILAYFYSLYSLTYPPMRMPAPAVQLINTTGAQATVQLSWIPPFSPTSPIVSYQVRVTSNGTVPLTAAQSLFLTFSNLTTFQYTLRRDGSTAYAFAVTACNNDFPYPPIVAPLLYSTPYLVPTGNVAVNSSILLLSPPSVPNAPQVYLASAPNITVYVGFPTGLNLSCALSTSPCYAYSPLTSIALFYTNDQSGSSQNFTWVTQPVWSFTPSTWSWYALATGLAGNQFYAFKVQVSNAAGGVNTSVSSGFLLPGSPANPVISSTASSSTNPSSAAPVSLSTGAAVQSVHSSSSPTSSTAATGTRVGNVSATSTSSTSASSTAPASSAAMPPLDGSSLSSAAYSASSAGTVDEASSSSFFPMPPFSHSSSSSSYFFGTSASDGSSFGASSNDSLIAGVIIGAFVGIVLLTVLTYCCFFRKRHMSKKPTPPHSTAASTYASPRPSASLGPVALYERGAMSPTAVGVSNRRMGGRRSGAALSAEGDMEMAELEAEWEGDDTSHQMRPPPQPTHHPAVLGFRR